MEWAAAGIDNSHRGLPVWRIRGLLVDRCRPHIACLRETRGSTALDIHSEVVDKRGHFSRAGALCGGRCGDRGAGGDDICINAEIHCNPA